MISLLHVPEDNDAVIKMINGRRGARMRHVSRTPRQPAVALLESDYTGLSKVTK